MNKIKKFWKKYGYSITNTMIAAGAFIFGYAAFDFVNAKLHSNGGTYIPKSPDFDADAFMGMLDAIEADHEWRKKIDEDIYTRVAPEIEDAVLCEGLDEYRIDATYDVKYPLGGEPDKGYYTVQKNVQVMVRDMT